MPSWLLSGLVLVTALGGKQGNADDHTGKQHTDNHAPDGARLDIAAGLWDRGSQRNLLSIGRDWSGAELGQTNARGCQGDESENSGGSKRGRAVHR